MEKKIQDQLYKFSGNLDSIAMPKMFLHILIGFFK